MEPRGASTALELRCIFVSSDVAIKRRAWRRPRQIPFGITTSVTPFADAPDNPDPPSGSQGSCCRSRTMALTVVRVSRTWSFLRRHIQQEQLAVQPSPRGNRTWSCFAFTNVSMINFHTYRSRLRRKTSVVQSAECQRRREPLTIQWRTEAGRVSSATISLLILRSLYLYPELIPGSIFY